MNNISLDFINKIRSAKRVYFHSGCPDGIMARNFLKLLLEDNKTVEYIPHNPGQAAEIVEGVVFVDLSPIKEQFEGFMNAGALILDHHDSAKPLFVEYTEKGYGDQLLFGDTANAESGTWLVYQCLYIWNNRFVPGEVREYNNIHHENAAKMIAVGDCWDKRDMDFFERSRFVGLWIALHGNSYEDIPNREFITQAQKYGEMKKEQDKRVAKSYILHEMNGFRIAFYNTRDGISDIADIAREEYNCDIIINWYCHAFDDPATGHRKNVTAFSLRSNDRFDCGAFAKSILHGNGGGHKKAAGFQLSGVLNAISIVEDYLDRYFLQNLI